MCKYLRTTSLGQNLLFLLVYKKTVRTEKLLHWKLKLYRPLLVYGVSTCQAVFRHTVITSTISLIFKTCSPQHDTGISLLLSTRVWFFKSPDRELRDQANGLTSACPRGRRTAWRNVSDPRPGREFTDPCASVLVGSQISGSDISPIVPTSHTVHVQLCSYLVILSCV